MIRFNFTDTCLLFVVKTNSIQCQLLENHPTNRWLISRRFWRLLESASFPQHQLQFHTLDGCPSQVVTHKDLTGWLKFADEIGKVKEFVGSESATVIWPPHSIVLYLYGQKCKWQSLNLVSHPIRVCPIKVDTSNLQANTQIFTQIRGVCVCMCVCVCVCMYVYVCVCVCVSMISGFILATSGVRPQNLAKLECFIQHPAKSSAP